MTLLQFRSLDAHMQHDLLTHAGTFLMARTGVGVHVLLYQFDGFYAEVYYDQQSTRIERIQSFEETEALEPYLKRIDISSVKVFL